RVKLYKKPNFIKLGRQGQRIALQREYIGTLTGRINRQWGKVRLQKKEKPMGTVFEGVRWGRCVGLFIFGLVVFVAVVPVFAQLPTGTILGTVKDTSGAVIPGATVTAQNVETGTSRTTLSDETGAYRLAAMPVGHYDLRAELSG